MFSILLFKIETVTTRQEIYSIKQEIKDNKILKTFFFTIFNLNPMKLTLKYGWKNYSNQRNK
jgi:hypothetical protein